MRPVDEHLQALLGKDWEYSDITSMTHPHFHRLSSVVRWHPQQNLLRLYLHGNPIGGALVAPTDTRDDVDKALVYLFSLLPTYKRQDTEG